VFGSGEIPEKRDFSTTGFWTNRFFGAIGLVESPEKRRFYTTGF